MLTMLCVIALPSQLAVAAVETAGNPTDAVDIGGSDDDDDDKPKSRGSFSGNVSWYGGSFNGRKTASGEIFDSRKITAAHRRLPFQTKVLVENPKTGKSCVVKINDRGPFHKGRVLDLSQGSMRRVAPFMPGIIYADCLILDDG